LLPVWSPSILKKSTCSLQSCCHIGLQMRDARQARIGQPAKPPVRVSVPLHSWTKVLQSKQDSPDVVRPRVSAPRLLIGVAAHYLLGFLDYFFIVLVFGGCESHFWKRKQELF
jgi:hypothetical protein